MRIDKINNNANCKKLPETAAPHRRAFEAEEKLKKLAEQADLAKKMVSTPSKESNSPKSSQGKTEESKKSSATQRAATRKKIQIVLQKVKNVQKKGLLNTQKGQLLMVGKKQPLKSTKTLNKVVSTKVGFQRHSKKNLSQRPTNSKVMEAKLKNVKGKGVVNNNNNISKTEIVKSKTLKSVLQTRAGTSKNKSGNGTPKNNVQKKGKIFICNFFSVIKVYQQFSFLL